MNVRFVVFTAVTMKNGVFWDIKTHVRFEVFSGDYEELCLLGCYAVWLL
jgi:hypothetical protein